MNVLPSGICKVTDNCVYRPVIYSTKDNVAECGHILRIIGLSHALVQIVEHGNNDTVDEQQLEMLLFNHSQVC